MIQIKQDYNGFAHRNSTTLNQIFGDAKVVIDFCHFSKCDNIIDCGKLPFATISEAGWDNVYSISYNPSIIEKCKLGEREQDAFIFHEIGHIVALKESNSMQSLELEEYCDSVAVENGFGFDMLDALHKMLDTLDLCDENKEDLKHRIEKIGSTQMFFRPEWTCGRYNRAKNVALLYNLIEGMSFFYEDITAEVVGCILSVPRNEPFDLKTLSQQSNVNITSLVPFIQQLEQYGLIIRKVLVPWEIVQYRENLKKVRRQQVYAAIDALHEMTVVGTSNAERMYAEKVGGITSVMFELTYRCSEMCLHCYNAGATRNDTESSTRASRRELDFKEYKEIIDQLIDMGLIKVCLSGGDPFSTSVVWDIIEYLYKREIAVDIFTNGITVVNQVERLANLYPRTIGVSLYSDIPEVHDSITRVKGSHDKTVQFIAKCSQFSLPMILKCCIMKPNVSSYYTVKSIALKYGALPQFDLNITDSVEGDRCASTHLRLGHKELEIVLRDKDLPYYIGKGGVRQTERHEEDLICTAGLNTLCVTPEGNLQPCCAFPLKLGNVRRNTIDAILKSSKILEWWQKQRLKDCIDCNKHPYCAYCQMCVGNNFIAHGNPLVACENNCFLAKERYELAVKMQEGYDPLGGKSVEEAISEIKIDISELRRIPSVNRREEARINGVS